MKGRNNKGGEGRGGEWRGRRGGEGEKREGKGKGGTGGEGREWKGREGTGREGRGGEGGEREGQGATAPHIWNSVHAPENNSSENEKKLFSKLKYHWVHDAQQ
jgi:hypothetical protein